MRIIEQSHEILSPHPQNDHVWRDMLSLIETAGRTCYQSEPVGDPADFVRRKIMKSGHHSVIEHGVITVCFITDRGVTHELVRHRLAAYSQESTRYCDYGGNGINIIRPVWCNPDVVGNFPVTEEQLNKYTFSFPDNVVGADRYWMAAMYDADVNYNNLRRQGWSPQQARAVLPNSLKTEIIMTANLREWLHVLNLRTSKAAHPQIRELMLPLLSDLNNKLPCIFEDLFHLRNNTTPESRVFIEEDGTV